MLLRKFSKINNEVDTLARRRSVRNFSGVAVANLFSTLISLGLSLFLPKLLGVVDYSYWQLYIFYVSYVGIMHLGVADGVYLRYGGHEYRKLNKELVRSQFWMVIFFQLAIFIVLAITAPRYIEDNNKLLIAWLVGINFILVNARTFLQMLLQATDRALDFSKNIIYDRLIYIALVAAMLAVGYYNFQFLLYADIVAKSVMLLVLCYVCRDVVFGVTRIAREAIREIWKNLSAGIKLMLANLTGMLVVGIVRVVIEYKWGVTTFGQVSLMLAASSLVLIFITSAGMITYPILKRVNPGRLTTLYLDLRIMLVATMLLFLILYFPAYWMLSLWLPHYSEALLYLPLLFPLSFYEAKTHILTNTYLKAYRKESRLLLINLTSLVVAIIMVSVAAFLLQDLGFALLVIVIALAIKSGISEWLLGKTLGIDTLKSNLQEFSLVALFIGLAWFLPHYALPIYATIILVYLVNNRRVIEESYRRTLQNEKSG